MQNNSISQNIGTLASHQPSDDHRAKNKPSVTLQGVLNILDEFRCNAIITAGSIRVSGALGRSKSPGSTEELERLFLQTVFVEMIYGGVGIFVLFSLMSYALCAGRIANEGCGAVLKDTLGGNNYLHFLAALLSCASGVFGYVGLQGDEIKEHYLQLSAILTMFSKTLVTGSKSKQSRKKYGNATVPQTASLATSSVGMDELGRERINNHFNSAEHGHYRRTSERILHEPVANDDHEANVAVQSSIRSSPMLFAQRGFEDDLDQTQRYNSGVLVPSAASE